MHYFFFSLLMILHYSLPILKDNDNALSLLFFSNANTLVYIPFIKSLIFPSGNLTTQDILFRALVNSIISKTSYSTVFPFFSWTENRFEFQKLGTVLKSAQNRRKYQNSVFAETEYVILLVHLRASQNMFWNFHNPAFFWFIGVYVVFQDFDQKSPKKIPIYCSL